MRALTKDLSSKGPSLRAAKTSNDVSPAAQSTPWHALHQTLGNQGVQRLLRAGVIQAKLEVSQLGDALEQEADRAAEQVLSMPQPEHPDDPEAHESTRLSLSRYASGTSAQRSPEVPPIVHDVVRSPGEPLNPATRAFVEPRFERDFGEVRMHTDAQAAQSARAVDSLAYTAGSHIVFGAGQFVPATRAGQRLLAHELTHVVQQSGNAAAMDTLAVDRDDSPLERDADRVSAAVSRGQSVNVLGSQAGGAGQVQRVGFGDLRVAEARESLRERLVLDYKKAEKGNKTYAKSGPAWGTKLETAAGGAYKTWHDLWAGGKYSAFADNVASFQIDLGLPEKSIDGILGPMTWARLAGIGEAMASIEEVTWPESETTCTTSNEERIKRGYKLATGKPFELPEDRNASTFNVILQSISNRLLDVPADYRGTGPAGAFVYAGLGKFVSESDIWAGKLEPGAVVQVWNFRSDYDLLRVGEKKGEDGKMRRINDSDGAFLGFNGTSFVFVRYHPETNNRMWVRHDGRSQWKEKDSYQVWVAANPVTPEAQLPRP